jgi:hypothetical protein
MSYHLCKHLFSSELISHEQRLIINSIHHTALNAEEASPSCVDWIFNLNKQLFGQVIFIKYES